MIYWSYQPWAPNPTFLLNYYTSTDSIGL